jgi:hypothetical protein
MRVLGDWVRFGGLFVFALGLARCSGTSETEPRGDAGDAGEGASGGATAGSGGSVGGAGRGGSAGAGGSAGSGGSAAGGGSAQGGSSGSAGAAGTPIAGRGGTGSGGGKTGGTGGGAGTPNAGTAGTSDVAGAAGEGGEPGGEGGAAGVGGSDDGVGGEPSGSGGEGGASEPSRLEGDLCSTALTLAGTASGSTSEFTNDHNRASCLGWDLPGGDVAYSFSIPPLSRYTIVADPSDAFDLALYVVTPPAENCTAVPTCTVAADLAIEGRNETLVMDNYESEWRSYFLMVDGYGALTSNGTYALTASSALIPEGEVCETATPLTVGEPVTATLDGFAPDYTGRPACISASASGADAVYSVTVPAGNTLTIVATPTGNMDVALYAFDVTSAAQCRTATACLAGADVGFGGGAETLTYTNTGATRTVFVHVDRFDQGSAVGGYTLTSSLAPAP